LYEVVCYILYMMGARGALIVVEGLDRSGKSTQCRRIIQSLTAKGCPVKAMKFPDRTSSIGQMINSYLQQSVDLNDTAIHLLFSANRWEQQYQMIQDLHNGITLVVDRYAYSGVAFTAAKEGFTFEWCKQSDAGLPKPDLVLFLEVSAEKAAERGGYGEERYEKTSFQEKVHKNFTKLKTEGWQVVDAGQSLDDVHREIMLLVEKAVGTATNKPIEKLWTS